MRVGQPDYESSALSAELGWLASGTRPNYKYILFRASVCQASAANFLLNASLFGV